MNLIYRTDWSEKASKTHNTKVDVYESVEHGIIVEKYTLGGSAGFDYRLSIKKHNKSEIRNWRLIQDIKNNLVGKDRVGIELYPKEKDVTDTANIYHIWICSTDCEPPIAIVPYKESWNGNCPE